VAPLAPTSTRTGRTTVLVNLSASNELLGKADAPYHDRLRIGRCIAGTVTSPAASGESSTTWSFPVYALTGGERTILKESEDFRPIPAYYADIDLDRLAHDRRTMTSFGDASMQADDFDIIETDVVDFVRTSWKGF